MIALLSLLLFAIGLVVGVRVGRDIGIRRAVKGMTLRTYLDAIALCDDLVKTPDAMDLRPRAQQILAAHAKNRE